LERLLFLQKIKSKELIFAYKTSIHKVTYNTETEEMEIKLKPIFQALRIVKDNPKLCSEKITTLPKVSSKTVLDYLTKNIELSLKNKVTTLEILTIKETETLTTSVSDNGASNGLLTDPLLNQLKNITQTAECQYCLYNLSKLAA